MNATSKTHAVPMMKKGQAVSVAKGGKTAKFYERGEKNRTALMDTAMLWENPSPTHNSESKKKSAPPGQRRRGQSKHWRKRFAKKRKTIIWQRRPTDPDTVSH